MLKVIYLKIIFSINVHLWLLFNSSLAPIEGLRVGSSIKRSLTSNIFDLNDLQLYNTNISYSTFEIFENNLSTVYYEPHDPVHNDSIIIGGENILYRLTLNKTRRFNFEQKIDFNPLNIDCQTFIKIGNYNTNLHKEQFSSLMKINIVKNIFPDHTFKFVWACGTGDNGACLFLNKSNIAMNKHFGNSCLPLNMITSKESSVVLPLKYKNRFIYYVGFEYDNRLSVLNPPFLSIRMPTIPAGFEFAIKDEDTKNDQVGQIKLHPSMRRHFQIKFLFTFELGGFIYFLTIQRTQYNNPDIMETKLARICTNDLQLKSWVQIPLVCQHNKKTYSMATVASLEKEFNRTDRGYIKGNSNSISERLYVAFFEDSNDEMSNVICDYEMNKVAEIFAETSRSCHTSVLPKAKLMEAIYGVKKLCNQLEGVMDYICHYPNNHYIDGEIEMTSKALITVLNDKITMIESVSMHDPRLTDLGARNRLRLFVGTEKSRIMEFEIYNSGSGLRHLMYLNQLPFEYGSILPNPQFDSKELSFVVLSEHAVFYIPFESCSIYTSCSSCLSSQSDCYWSKGKCSQTGDPFEAYSCPPEIYYYHPKNGPTQGGTTLTFIGTNFGAENDSPFDNPNNKIEITVGDANCEVIKRSNELVQCKLSESNMTFNYDQNNGHIQFYARDANHQSVQKRFYVVDGKTDLEEKFKFHSPSIRGVYPDYGPYLGGTEVLVLGENLSIGSSQQLVFGNTECLVTHFCSSFVVCVTQPQQSLSNKVREQIELKIDGFFDFINSDDFLLETIKFGRNNTDSKCIDRFAPSTMALKLFDQTTAEFYESFEFRPNPVIYIDKVHVLYIGHEITVNGEHFSSIHRRPTFTIYIDDVKVIDKSYCNDIINDSSFTCLVPELNNSQQQQGWIVFQLDGYEKKCILNIYNRPLFNSNEAYEIQQQDKLLTITNVKNFHDDIPFSVTVNDTYECSKMKVSESEIICMLNVTDSQLSYLTDSNLSVEIKVGETIFKAGNARIKPTSRRAALLLSVFVGFGILIILLAIIFLSNIRAKSKLNKYKSKEYRMLETKFYDEIRKHFIDCFGNDNFYQELYHNDRLIPQDKVVESCAAGSGHYSTVYRGYYNNFEVAIKTIKFTENINDSPEQKIQELKFFLMEAEFMKDFHHPNVISLLGVTMYADLPAILTPFMANGNLSSYIAKEDIIISILDFYNFVLQIAQGMEYLVKKNVVHRDLAARNVLIDNVFNLKVSDFGLTRNFKPGRDYYRQNNDVGLPLGWMAIETQTEARFTTKSDVWSFGVLMWEILARGGKPWDGIKKDEIIFHLKKGERLKNPHPTIPDELYQFANQCWAENPDNRPSFSEIIEQVNNILRKQSIDQDDEYYSRQIVKYQNLNNSAMEMQPQLFDEQISPMMMNHSPSSPPIPAARMPRIGLNGIDHNSNRLLMANDLNINEMNHFTQPTSSTFNGTMAMLNMGNGRLVE